MPLSMPADPHSDRPISPLQAVEAINRSILDSALDCIIAMDASGIVREFNPAAERVFGYTRDEAVGKELAGLIIPPMMRESHRRGLARYLQTGEGPVLNRRIEINALRRDGSEIMVELAISPIRIAGAAFFTAYLRDITERKRDEDARRRLAAIVESSEDAILSTDLNMTITSWNRGAERLFGYTATEVIGRPITILIPPERRDEEPQIIERVRRDEPVRHYETLRCRKDGTLLNVALSVSPIKDANGTVIGASKIARDISERVRSERRRLAQYTVASLLAGSWTLAEAGTPILQAVASMGDWIYGAIWLDDEEGGVLRCKRIWRRDSKELAEFAAFSESIEFGKGEGLPGRVWQSKQPAWIADVTEDQNFPRRDGAKKARLRGAFGFPLLVGSMVNGVIELFAEHVIKPDDDLLKLAEVLGSQIGLFIERRKIERELLQAKESAEAASAAKDRFIAMLSHELRTPLTPVLIWASEMVKEAGLSGDIEDGLKMVCRNVELEARLIDDLLDLTRIRRGKLKLRLSPADVHELLQHAIQIVGTEMKERSLPITLSLDLKARHHRVLVDGPRLQQVFWNNLRNAYKFSPPNGIISVRSCNPSPDFIRIEIADQGVGVEPEFLDKIFAAFEQVESGREGLGLGLAISKAVIEMHGGSISARSAGRGQGATFIIDLPLGHGDVRPEPTES
jgi:PAS domain S-box-containing protein